MAVYPGIRTAGVCLAVVRDREITQLAVGSVPIPAVLSTVEQFNADLVVVEPRRDSSLDATPFDVPDDVKLQFVHPTWNSTPRSLPPAWARRTGYLGRNAWRMMFAYILDRSYAIGNVRPVRFSRVWIKEHNGTRHHHS